MNIAAFTTLRAILEHGSFTAAAAAVGCTPSAVSLQVKQLELFLGQPLFDRSTRAVLPTALAKDLAAAVAQFIGQVEALRLRPTVTVAGRLRLGVITSMQSEALPRALLALRNRYPLLEAQVAPLNDSAELLAEVKAGRLDVALLVRPEDGGSKRLLWQDLHRQPYVLLAPPGVRLASPEALLKAHGWIAYDLNLPGGRVASRLVHSLCADARCATELRSIDAIVAMVSLGMGVTVLPQPRRKLLEAYGVQEVGLGRKAPSRRLAAVWRKTDEDSRNIAAVVESFAAALAGSAGA